MALPETLLLPLTPQLAFFSFGFGELLVVGTVALLVFGGDLPDVMRTIGRSYAKFRQGLQDMSKPVREEFKAQTKDLPKPSELLEGGQTPTPAASPADEPAPAASRYPPYESPSATSSSADADDPWDDLDEPPPV